MSLILFWWNSSLGVTLNFIFCSWYELFDLIIDSIALYVFWASIWYVERQAWLWFVQNQVFGRKVVVLGSNWSNFGLNDCLMLIWLKWCCWVDFRCDRNENYRKSSCFEPKRSMAGICRFSGHVLEFFRSSSSLSSVWSCLP